MPLAAAWAAGAGSTAASSAAGASAEGAGRDLTATANTHTRSRATAAAQVPVTNRSGGGANTGVGQWHGRARQRTGSAGTGVPPGATNPHARKEPRAKSPTGRSVGGCRARTTRTYVGTDRTFGQFLRTSRCAARRRPTSWRRFIKAERGRRGSRSNASRLQSTRCSSVKACLGVVKGRAGPSPAGPPRSPSPGRRGHAGRVAACDSRLRVRYGCRTGRRDRRGVSGAAS